MGENLVSIKVTPKTVRNFNGAEFFLDINQYEVAEIASEIMWKKAQKKIVIKKEKHKKR